MQKQTDQVKIKLPGRRLPLRVKPALSDSTPLVDNCPVTRRVILISPMPGQVHELVKALTDSCFDVLVFHRWEPDLHERLVFDLLIYDLSVAGTIDAFAGISSRLNREAEHTTPCLYLVGEKMIGSASGPMLQEELLVWPARPQEALYRVQRMIGNSPALPNRGFLPEDGHRIGFKDLWLDRERMSVQRDNNRIHLTKTEYDLLLKLIDAKGAVISREEMLSDIWETDFTGGSNVVDVHIKSLRKKLGDNASSPQYIVTVRGVGYRLAD